MGFFSGFSGEFGKQLQTSRAEEADRAERQSAMESQILQHLSTSPDPEIASHAITGLLDLAGPQKKAPGLAGWLGKVGAHPALPTIRQLVSQGRQVEDKGPVAPTAGVTEGLGAMPGQQVDIPGVASGPPAPRQTLGPPSSDEATPSALQPPPAPRSVAGTPFQPATSKTVPRKVFNTLEEQAGKTTRAELDAKVGAYEAASPEARQGVFGHQVPIVRTTDKDGNVHFFQGANEVGEAIGAGQPKTAPRPSADEAHLQARSAEILATNPGMTPEQATQQAQVEARAKTVATAGAAADAHLVRLGQIQAMVPATIAAWQRVNGTTPMTRAQAQAAASQALSAARQTLGAGPDVTPEDITRFADGLMAASDTHATGPKVSPNRAAQNQPLGGPPAPPNLTGTLQAAAPGLAGASAHPRVYSAQGKQTLQALGTVEPLLTKIVAGIRAAGLEEDNSVVGEQFNKLLYNMGISPGDIETQRLQLEGMSEAYGLRGLVGGRSNQILQNIYKQHLVSPGDSPKFVVQKTEDLLSILPLIRKAVDDSEGAQVGARGGAASPGGPPKPGGPPASATPGAVPPAVAAALKGIPAGKHTLSDGSVWVIDAAGHITKGG